MASVQEAYDEAMFDFSQGNYARAASKLEAVVGEDPAYLDARLSLAMAYFRQGDIPRAIAEGHKAEALAPKEQLVHTNLSLFYLKAGDKARAEHHGLQARIASWRGNLAPPSTAPASGGEIPTAKPETPGAATGPRFPEMPWKKPRADTEQT